MSEKCRWCDLPITRRQKYCSKRCRQAAYRLRRRLDQVVTDSRPKRLAYADPPYPGLAKRYYQHEESYAGEVDHRRLLEQLATYDGWALSTSSEALRDILPMCPPGVLVRPWVKPNHVAKWEPVIVSQARRSPAGMSDYLCTQPARGGGDLMGRKPIAFCAWIFKLLGSSPNDSFEDMFPGTGIFSSAWREFVSLGTVAAVPGRQDSGGEK